MNKSIKNILFGILFTALSSHATLTIENYTNLNQAEFNDAFIDEYKTCLNNSFFQKITNILDDSSETFHIIVMDQPVTEFIARASNIKDRETYYKNFFGTFLTKENVEKVFVVPAQNLLKNPANASGAEFLNELTSLKGSYVIALTTLTTEKTNTRARTYTEVSQKVIFQEVFHAAQHVIMPIYNQEPYNYFASSEVEGEIANLASGIMGLKPGQIDKRMQEIQKIPNINLFVNYIKNPKIQLTSSQIPLVNTALTAVWTYLKTPGSPYESSLGVIQRKFNKTPVEKITYDKMKVLLYFRNQK